MSVYHLIKNKIFNYQMQIPGTDWQKQATCKEKNEVRSTLTRLCIKVTITYLNVDFLVVFFYRYSFKMFGLKHPLKFLTS